MDRSPRLAWALFLSLTCFGCDNGSDGPPAGAPRAPDNLESTYDKDVVLKGVVLTWTDNSSDETSFEIYRTGDGQGWTRIASVDPDTIRYVDAVTCASSALAYTITAKNDKGESATAAKTEIQMPKCGGGYTCNLVLSDEGAGSREGAGPGFDSGLVCLCEPTPAFTIQDTAAYPSGGGVVELHGRSGDSIDILLHRSLEPDAVHLRGRIRWARPPEGDDWELCLALHDPSAGDVRGFLVQHGLAPWTAQRVRPLGLETFPVLAGRWYDVSVTIDRARQTWSLDLDHWPMARDVPLRDYLVMGARIVR